MRARNLITWLAFASVVCLTTTLSSPTIAQDRLPVVAQLDTMQLTIEKCNQLRANFKAHLLVNPNYFGNLPEKIGIAPVIGVVGNTIYEELTCLGLAPSPEPGRARLQAVVHIKRTMGYGGGICSPGTREYVRFYLSHDNGMTWIDQGISSFRAFNVPAGQPLAHAVTLNIDPQEQLCTTENLPLVRAILSWNQAPPPDTPSFSPVWGNVKQVRVQIDKLKLYVIEPVMLATQDTLLADLGNLIKKDAKIELAEPPVLGPQKLHQLYAKNKLVGPKRYLFSHGQQLLKKPQLSQPIHPPTIGKPLLGVDVFDWSSIIGAPVTAIDTGDTQYERITCVGLNAQRRTLVGIVHVKLSSGYSGDLCTAGSTEYVAFWVDWGGGTWDYIGTSSVNVHDLQNIPGQGLYYAVDYPIDVTPHQRPCTESIGIIKVRAILSWETPPPPADPGYVPRWGNRVQARALLLPGPLAAEDPLPFFMSVGGMVVDDIDSSGLATGTAVVAGFQAAESPFGGVVVICGKIRPAPDLSAGGATPLEYKISVKQEGVWKTVDNTFMIRRTEWKNGVATSLPAIAQSAADGWYPYREDPHGDGGSNPEVYVVNDVLTRWHTGGQDGLWSIRFEARERGGTAAFPVSDGIVITLDNTAPVTSIDITSGGGECADFTIENDISGIYSATDAHFGHLQLWLLPKKGGGFAAPPPASDASTRMPLQRFYPQVHETGESNVTWTLDTTGLPQCGYLISVTAWDRTIVNSGSIGRHRGAVVGLCLRPD